MRWICLLGQVLNPIKEPFLFANFRVKNHISIKLVLHKTIRWRLIEE